MKAPVSETILDYKAITAHGGVVFDPARHKIPRYSQFLVSILHRAREMRCTVTEHLFMYRHAGHGTWVLAYWIPESRRGIKGMVELWVCKDNPDHIAPKKVINVVLDRLRPRMAKFRKIRDAMRDADKKVIVKRQREGERQKDHVRHLRKIGDHLGARLIEQGRMPVAFDEE